jgi:hypothetical protein
MDLAQDPVVLLQPPLPQTLKRLLHDLLLFLLFAPVARLGLRLHGAFCCCCRRGLVAAEEMLQDATFLVAQLA